MNNYYVYVHRIPSTGKIFYVGKGKGRRAYVKGSRSKEWNKIVEEYSYIVEIAVQNLTSHQALVIENEYIEFYGIENLVNKNKGFGGCDGSNYSSEMLTFKNLFSDESIVCTKWHAKNIYPKISQLNNILSRKRSATKDGWICLEYFDFNNLDAVKNKWKGMFASSCDLEKYSITNIDTLEKKLLTKVQMKEMGLHPYPIVSLKQSSKRWILSDLLENITIEDLRKKLSRSGKYNVKRDNKEYLFSNLLNGDEFIGTRHSFCEKYNKSSKNIEALFYNKNRKKSTKDGWTITKVDN